MASSLFLGSSYFVFAFPRWHFLSDASSHVLLALRTLSFQVNGGDRVRGLVFTAAISVLGHHDPHGDTRHTGRNGDVQASVVDAREPCAPCVHTDAFARSIMW